MNEMKGKIVLITGCTDGVAKQTAYALAAAGAVILIHARDFTSGTAALRTLQDRLPHGFFDLFIGNFETQSEVEQLAKDIQFAYPKIDVLVNNETLYVEDRRLTGESIEKTFAVNHLAAFLLTHLLLPLLKNAGSAMVINVSSNAHFMARFDRNNLQGEKKFDGTAAFCSSKLCNLLFTYALAERLEGQHVYVNAVDTGFFVQGNPDHPISRLPGQADEEGADTIVFLATTAEVATASGMYFMSRMPVESSYASYNRRSQQQLWRISEQLAMIENYFPFAEKVALQGRTYGVKRLIKLVSNAMLKFKSGFLGDLLPNHFIVRKPDC